MEEDRKYKEKLEKEKREAELRVKMEATRGIWQEVSIDIKDIIGGADPNPNPDSDPDPNPHPNTNPSPANLNSNPNSR